MKKIIFILLLFASLSVYSQSIVTNHAAIMVGGELTESVLSDELFSAEPSVITWTSSGKNTTLYIIEKHEKRGDNHIYYCNTLGKRMIFVFNYRESVVHAVTSEHHLVFFNITVL